MTNIRWWISVDNSPNGVKHTVITFDLIAPYVTKFACSCGAQSDNLPSLRPENKCDVCSDSETPLSYHDDIEALICDNCYENFAAWLLMHPELPAIDWLREKLTS